MRSSCSRIRDWPRPDCDYDLMLIVSDDAPPERRPAGTRRCGALGSLPTCSYRPDRDSSSGPAWSPRYLLPSCVGESFCMPHDAGLIADRSPARRGSTVTESERHLAVVGRIRAGT